MIYIIAIYLFLEIYGFLNLKESFLAINAFNDSIDDINKELDESEDLPNIEVVLNGNIFYNLLLGFSRFIIEITFVFAGYWKICFIWFAFKITVEKIAEKWTDTFMGYVIYRFIQCAHAVGFCVVVLALKAGYTFTMLNFFNI